MSLKKILNPVCWIQLLMMATPMVGAVFISTQPVVAQTTLVPFTCDSYFYMLQDNNSNTKSELYRIDRQQSPYTETQVIPGGFSPAVRLNALAYNKKDGYFYAMGAASGSFTVLYRIDKNNAVSMGAVANVTTPGNAFVNGTFDDQGNYYIRQSTANTFYKIAINGNTLTATSFSVSASASGDIAFNPVDKKLYSVGKSGSGVAVSRIDLVTPSTTSIPISNSITGGSVDSVFFDSMGTLYAHTSSPAFFYQMPNVASGGSSITQASSATSAVYTDGASCPFSTISGTVFEDVNYGGGAGRSLSGSSGVGLGGATVELYDSSGIMRETTTTSSLPATLGQYSFILAWGDYTVRVVNSTVTSARTGYTASLIPVQTFRTNAGTTAGTVTLVTDRVGGEKPAEIDASAGTVNTTLLNTLNSGINTEAQSVTAVKVAGSNVTGIDFGFNFDTIVNTNDSGQGSLRQFINNSNALHDESNLAQLGQPAGYETSIFMIPNGVANPGQNTSTGYASQLNSGGIAVINLSAALPSIADTKTRLDGATQTINVKTSGSLETNPGQLGTGGTIGIDKVILPLFNRPEVEIKGLYTLTSTGDYNEIKNIAFNANRLFVAGNNSLVQDNLVGMQADGTVTAATAGVSSHGLELGAGNDIIVRHNYVRVNESGIRRNATSNHLTIENNEVDLPTSGQTTTYDGILLIGSGTNDIIRNNLTKNQRGGGIEVGFAGGTLTNTLIENNTVLHNGYAGANSSTETMGVAAYWLTPNSSVVFRKNIITQSSGPGVVVMNAAGIKLTQNSIFANGLSGNGFGLSIDLDPNTRDPNIYHTVLPLGVTPNNGTVSATLPNGEMDYPIFTKAQRVGNTLKLKGYIGINPAGNTAFANATIEIYKADNSDTNQNGEVIAGDTQSKSHGEGRYYIGTIPTDANGLFDTTLTIPVSLTDGITNTTFSNTDLLTAITTSSATATITPNSTSEFSEDIPITTGNPNVLLVKRITEVNGSPFNGYEDSDSRYDDNVISAPTALEPQPDTEKWPNPPSSFLQGKIDGGTIKPNDSIEYTIYFISAGDDAAQHVFFCDRVPTNVTFLETAFNNLTPNSAALSGADRGIAIKIGGNLRSYTNAGGDDLARYFPPNQEPIYNDYAQFFPGVTPTFLAKKICDAPNTNGAIVVNLGTVPNAVGAGDPPESSGFIRFQGKVK